MGDDSVATDVVSGEGHRSLRRRTLVVVAVERVGRDRGFFARLAHSRRTRVPIVGDSAHDLVDSLVRRCLTFGEA
jgi:hypothetical protein